MFGLVSANLQELSKEEKARYNAVYCGICRQIREQCSSAARIGLSYDMAFLALLLMSLYEPEEETGSRACGLHPIKPRSWVDNEYIRYCACMNVALGYYKALDDGQDEGRLQSKMLCKLFGRDLEKITTLYPRQCAAIEACLKELAQLEKDNCPNPDLPAGCFGRLLGELFVYREDMWVLKILNLTIVHSLIACQCTKKLNILKNGRTIFLVMVSMVMDMAHTNGMTKEILNWHL